MVGCVDHMLGAMKLPAAAVMGFCLGGRYAVVMAGKEKRLAACVPYYPSIRVPNKPNESEDALALAAQIACSVHLVHGSADKVFLEQVFETLRGILEQRGVATMVQVHPAPTTASCGRTSRQSGQRDCHPAVVAAGGVVPAGWPAGLKTASRLDF